MAPPSLGFWPFLWGIPEGEQTGAGIGRNHNPKQFGQITPKAVAL
jgi:hypothetical protein